MMISYAQNYEDVMLWRALGHVEEGFYVDVGAGDPSLESVTKAFYDQGWRGVNIEPLSVHFADLQRERPRDTNIRCAAGPSTGEIALWDCAVRGWASVDKVVIEEQIAAGKVGSYHQVPMLTLAEICEQNAPANIHFLKIDVEGFERPVLEGMNFQRFRPWIVVVEATRPNSTEEAHQQWEDLLIGANYVFVYADGLNRFYVAREHEELSAAFRYPPNVFDGFTLATQVEACVRAQAAEARSSRAEIRAEQAEARAAQFEERAARSETREAQAKAHAALAEHAVNDLLKSYSWRITGPLRVAHERFSVDRWFKLKRRIGACMATLSLMKKQPCQEAGAQAPPCAVPPPVKGKIDTLTPHARQTYVDLKEASARRHKERT